MAPSFRDFIEILGLPRACSKRVNALYCERFGGICKADRLGITSKWGYSSRSNAADAPNRHNPKGWGTLALSCVPLEGQGLASRHLQGRLAQDPNCLQQRVFTLFEQALTTLFQRIKTFLVEETTEGNADPPVPLDPGALVSCLQIRLRLPASGGPTAQEAAWKYGSGNELDAQLSRHENP